METSRLLAVDPSLTCTGWALFCVERGHLLGVGSLKALPPSVTMPERLAELQGRINKVYESLKLGSKDIVFCEAPTTMKDPRAAITVEQVRSIFETIARARGVVVPGRINPRSVHNLVMGLRGKQLPRAQIKEMAVSLVATLYTKPLQALGFDVSKESLKKNQDIVDALLLGNLGLTWIREARACAQPLVHYVADRTPTRSQTRWQAAIKRGAGA
jgi:Holliday junction resolvasome RuvABC endonuclease subunit